jgi:MFS family permease
MANSSASQGLLRSLRHRNFRLFFGGQGISLIGTWMQQVAMSWLVYTMTGDALKMGLVAFASQIPSVLLVPFIGVFLDRWNRHRVVIMTQILAMIQASVLAALVIADIIEFWHVILLSLFMGCVNAFDMPARQSFLPEMLTDKEDLSNAIALNSSLFNGARLVGPSLAGMLIAYVGMEFCFLANAASFIAVIVALLAMTIPRRPRVHVRSPMLHGLKEGFSYAFGFPPIRALILLIAMISFAGVPYTVLLPLFTSDKYLGGGAVTLGFLMTAAGVGALIGAIYMASRLTVLGLGVRITVAACLFSVVQMIFSQSTSLLLSLGLLVLSGLGMMVTMAGCNTILQTIVEDDKRGRVMSLYTAAFMGMSPLGSVLAGALANWIGPQWTLLICGGTCLLAALLFARKLPGIRSLVRPIYIEKGILAPPSPPGETVPELLVPVEE